MFNKIMDKLELTIDETNLVLQALGNAPYTQVVALVDKIKTQGIPQVEAAAVVPTEMPVDAE